jgi:enoyl-CoA hydratase/carnithine racemase
MTGDESLVCEQRGAVRWITLNRPHARNALTPGLIAAFRSALDDAGDDRQTAVVVVAGNGPSFCAGADLRHLQQLSETGEDPSAFLREVSACFEFLEELPRPVIAAVHGHCVAGGLELALACDLVIAERGTLIGDGHVRNGLIPAGGASVRLPRRLPEPMARRLMLTGQLVPAEELAPFGLPHVVAEPGALPAAVNDVVADLCAADPSAQRAVKHLLNQLRRTPDELAYDCEAKAFASHWATADVQTPLARFVARSRPANQEV